MPDVWVRRVLLTASAAVAALWASGTVAAGPVPSSGAGVCMPWPGGELAAVTPIVSNDGPVPVTITHLALRDPVDVTIESAYLVPDHVYPGGGRLAFGFGPFPPSFDPVEGSPELEAPWGRRVEAVGGQVPPGEVHSLVIGLRQTPDGQPGSLTGFDIAYADGVRSHRVSMVWDIMIVPETGTCEAWADS